MKKRLNKNPVYIHENKIKKEKSSQDIISVRLTDGSNRLNK